ncbi:MAG: phosphatidate cytidylyltransferase [Dehalococcoidia bacterium]|nr:phosphatidate cytidylyltransferase [Dehalococcoidia bacterium]
MAVEVRNKQDISNLALRSLTGIIGIPSLIVVAWYGNHVLVPLIAVATTVAVWEFFKMAEHDSASPVKLFVLYAPFFAISAWQDASIGFVVAGAVMLPLVGLLIRRRGNPFHSWAWTSLGLLYAAWLPAHAILLRNTDDGKGWLFIAVFATFAVDIAAYFGGWAFGRHKLAPSISHGKTKEGAVFGFIGGVLAAWVISIPFDFIPVGEALAAGAVIGVVSQIGDLVESMIKRSVNVKDTGEIIPGHGGILDRMDSLVFSIPVIYYFFTRG